MEISDIISALMAEKKGILFTEATAGESERLASFGVGDEDARRAYRELLFTTPGIEAHLSGIILSPESLHEAAADGTPFPKLLSSKNILPGVLIASEVAEEKLEETLREYVLHGAAFAAFVAETSVSDEPVSEKLQKDIRTLTVRAKTALDAGLAPLLAVDVSMYGVHDAARAEDCILEALSLLSDALKAEAVDPARVIVASSMAVSGSDHTLRAHPAEVAERTVRAVTTALPENVGGVVFLSDAEGPEEATANLNALSRLEPLPWLIAFCFSRALEDPVLVAWKGNAEHFAEAQSIFEERLSILSRADAAAYGPGLEEQSLDS